MTASAPESGIRRAIADIDRCFGMVAGLDCWGFSGEERRSLRQIIAEFSLAAGRLHDVREPPPGWRARILGQCRDAIDELLAFPPSQVRRVRRRVAMRQAKEFDEVSLARLAMRPGRTVQEKLASEAGCISVFREFSHDVVEFEVVRRLLAGLAANEPDGTPAECDAESLRWMRVTRLNPLVAQATRRTFIRPTNRLLRHPVISRIWRAYLETRAAAGIGEKRWAERTRILAETLRLLVAGELGRDLLHASPIEVQPVLRDLSVNFPEALSLVRGFDGGRAIRFRIGAIERISDAEHRFTVAETTTLACCEGGRRVRILVSDEPIHEIEVDGLGSISRVAVEAMDLVLPGRPTRVAEPLRRGSEVVVDCGGNYPVLVRVSPGDTPVSITDPFAALAVGTGDSCKVYGGSDAVGARVFDSMDGELLSGERLTEARGEPLAAAMRAVADGARSLVVVTNDRMDIARDSEIFARQPRHLDLGLQIIPRSIAAMHAAEVLRCIDGAECPDAIAMVDLSESITVAWLTREELDGAKVWLRDPGRSLEAFQGTGSAASIDRWQRTSEHEWCRPATSPTPTSDESAESVAAIAATLEQLAPPETQRSNAWMLCVEGYGRRWSAADRERVAASLGLKSVRIVDREREMLPSALGLGQLLLERTAGTRLWWADRRPSLEVKVGKDFIPLFRDSGRTGAIAIGQRCVERSRVLVLPPDQKVRYQLRQVLRGQVFGEFVVDCLLQEAAAEPRRVFVQTEFVYGEGAWVLELRLQSDDRPLPGGRLKFGTRDEDRRKTIPRNWAPKIGSGGFWEPVDLSALEDIVRAIRRIPLDIKKALERWKASGRKRQDKELMAAIERAEEELREWDERIRRLRPRGELPDQQVAISIARIMDEYDAWLARRPIAAGDVGQRDPEASRRLDRCVDSLERIARRVRLPRGHVLPEVRRRLAADREESRIAGIELLCVTAPEAMKDGWDQVASRALVIIEQAIVGEGRGPTRSEGMRLVMQMVWTGPGLSWEWPPELIQQLAEFLERSVSRLKSGRDIRFWCMIAARAASLRNTPHDEHVNFAKTRNWVEPLRQATLRAKFERSTECETLNRWTSANGKESGIEWMTGLLDGTGNACTLQIPEDVA